jgi:hypothetical protein
MTNHEMELLRMIRETPDPAKTMETMMGILTRVAAGEAPEHIAADYGLDLSDT